MTEDEYAAALKEGIHAMDTKVYAMQYLMGLLDHVATDVKSEYDKVKVLLDMAGRHETN